MRVCPQCGQAVAESISACSCGAGLDEILRRERRSQATGQIALGAVLIVVGVIITAVTHDQASQSGGTYVIAYGPILFGVIRLVRGLVKLAG